jgi:hypothetical protein
MAVRLPLDLADNAERTAACRDSESEQSSQHKIKLYDAHLFAPTPHTSPNPPTAQPC